MSTPRHLVTTILAGALAFSSGCEFLEQFEDGGGLIDVYVTHNPTARDGEFPTHPADHFVVEGDDGWEIIVTDAYVTTTAITLHRCDGAKANADFYWGSKCEDLVGADVQAQGVGTVPADEGTYCSATVTYGPFAEDDGGHGGIDDGGQTGGTVYLTGVAKRGDVDVPFQLSTFGTATVEVDLSTIENGQPFSMDHDQFFNKQLTFSKTYDRFFDGIEFDQLDSMDLERVVVDTLELETDVVFGTEIRP